MLIIHMSNFVPIEYYLFYDLYDHIILNYKNMLFEQFIDDITINFLFSRNFAIMENTKKAMQILKKPLKIAKCKSLPTQLLLKMLLYVYIYIYIYILCV